jgi:hypothetical protein
VSSRHVEAVVAGSFRVDLGQLPAVALRELGERGVEEGLLGAFLA